MKAYPRHYDPGTSHAHTVEMLERALSRGHVALGVVLDLGCGYAPIAQAVTDLGFTYVGLDSDEASLEEVAAKGFEVGVLDLSMPLEQLIAELQDRIAGRPLAAIVALDVLEHLADPGHVVRACEALASDLAGGTRSAPCLIVSVPNVSHFDVAARLLLGRWDMTPTGLLDDTHLRFFSYERFRELFAPTRWREVDAQDTTAIHSDQYFLESSPALAPSAPLRNLLWRLRVTASPYATTYQFVRRFELGPERDPSEEGPEAVGPGAGDAPFLTVIARVGASDQEESAPALLADLAAQEDQDFELVVACRRTFDVAALLAAYEGGPVGSARVVALASEVRVDNVGSGMARGRYVSFLHADDRVGRRWVAAFRRGATEPVSGGFIDAVIRLDAAALSAEELSEGVGTSFEELVSGRRPVEPGAFDPLLDSDLGHPVLGAYAVPTSMHRTLGLAFDEHHGGLAATVFLVRAVELAGMRAVTDLQIAADEERFERPNLTALRVGLGDGPSVTDGATLARVFELQRALADSRERESILRGQVAQAQSHLELLGRFTRPVRRMVEAIGGPELLTSLRGARKKVEAKVARR